MDYIKYSELNDLYTELQDRLSRKLDETYIPLLAKSAKATEKASLHVNPFLKMSSIG